MDASDPIRPSKNSCGTGAVHIWVPACAGTTRYVVKRRGEKRAYASPSVSNIAALIASAAVFPAQTTNWNAG
jgi:hypothetical protein